MSNLVPYHIILAAKAGDSEAMDVILKHYEPFIVQLSTRSAIDEYGNTYDVVDRYMKERIESDLKYQIICNFDSMKLPPGETIED